MRFEGFLVTGNTHSADLGAWNQAEHTVEHADTSAQDRYYSNLLTGDFLDLDLTAPAFDLVGFEWQVFGGLVGQERADFLGEFAEILGADISAAHQAELVTDQRMADLTGRHRESSGGGQKNRGRLIYSAVCVL
ncbi:hypothetical protein D3C80_1573290 [compost metagenome]